MNHPHDRLFKATFSDPNVMVSLIEDLFPPELAATIDTNSLQISNVSFIDEQLEEYFADLVYQCSLLNGSTLTIALLLEHKSYPVKHPHLQLLRYILNHWQQNLEHNQSPTPIIPVIIYHGEGKWSANSLTEQMGDLPGYLHRFVPDFDYLLIDLSKMPDEQLFTLRSRFLAVSASLLKYSEKTKLRAFVRQQFVVFLRTLTTDQLQEFIRPIFRYIQEQTNLTGPEIVSIFSRVSEEQKTMAIMTYEQEKAFLLSRGSEQGRSKMLQTAALALHKAGYSPAQIVVALEATTEEVNKILSEEKR